MRTMHGQHFSYFAPEDDKGGSAGGGGAGAAAGAGDIKGAGATGNGDNGAGAGDVKGAGAGDGDKGGDKTGDWAPDWRQKLAGEDPKALKQLERYASPKDVWNKTRALEAKMSSGELRSTLPKDAKPEEVTAWRAENGIPESPDKYDLQLKDGLKIGKEDRPLVDSMLKTLHGQNATNAQASAVIDWYYSAQEMVTADRAAADQTIATKTSDELHGEWGQEYRLNMNKIEGLLTSMPADVRDLFKYGRLSNREPILANPGVLRALNEWARAINPVSTLVPNAGGDIGQAIDAEIKAIESNMRAPKGSPDYKKYWNDVKVQERYRELLDGRDRAKAAPAARA